MCCLFFCRPLVLFVTRLHCIAGITDVKDVGYVIVSVSDSLLYLLLTSLVELRLS